MTETEVRCRRCGKLLAKKGEGRLEIVNGNKTFRIYGQALCVIDCPRCGQTEDVVCPGLLLMKGK